MANYTFKTGWLPVLCTAVLLPVFLSLGFWQLRRADERQALIAERDRHGSEEPLHLSTEAPPSIEGIRYRRVVVSGRYDGAHQFLLDNQILDGQAGFHVLTPLRIEGGATAVLVNRGWVPLPADRAQLPDVSIPSDRIEIEGTVEKLPSVAWRLPGAELPATGWPALLQIAEPAALAKHLGYPLLPYQVLLGAAEPLGYARAWKPAAVDPGKNLGYALQWFSFAAILAALFIRHGLKRKSP